MLEGYLSDPNYLFRGDVFEALGDLGDPEAIPALERQSHAEGDVEQRLNIADAVKKLRDKAASAGKEDLDLRERVQQLEREVEVLKGRLEPKTPP
jgi:HEAT repeat protein